MTLREARVLFGDLLAKLIQHINGTDGFSCAIGEVLRSDEQAAINALKEDGRARLGAHLESVPEFHALAMAVGNNGKGNGILLSVHRDGLAVDLILYKNGVWYQDSEEYRQFAEWWQAQHPLARAGYYFRDPGHFSLEWNGRK